MRTEPRSIESGGAIRLALLLTIMSGLIACTSEPEAASRRETPNAKRVRRASASPENRKAYEKAKKDCLTKNPSLSGKKLQTCIKQTKMKK